MRANGVSFKRPPRNLVILRPSLKFWPTLSMFWYITKGLANFTFISMHFSLCKSHWSFIFFAYITINDIANNFKVRKDNLWHLLRGKNKLLAVTIVRDVILLALLVLGYHLHSFVYETPDLFLPLDPVHLEARHGQAGSRGGHGQVSGPAGSWQYRRPRGLAPARVSLPSKSHVAPPNPHVATTWLSRQNHVRKFPCPSYTWTCVITRYTLNYTSHVIHIVKLITY